MVAVDGVDMVDVREAARRVRRTPETVRRWIWSGRLEATKRGNRLLVRPADLAGLTAQQRGGEGAEERSAEGPGTGPVATLRAWVTEVSGWDRETGNAHTAADLVLADRARRAGADNRAGNPASADEHRPGA